MTYWNPVERYGVDAFARDLAAAGGAGLITPDLIPDEAGEWLAASDAHGLDRVFLVVAVVDRRAAGDDRRRTAAASSTPPRHGRHRRPRADLQRRAGAGRPGARGRPRAAGRRSGSACATARRRPRSARSPTG